MECSIIVITDFEKEFWRKFLRSVNSLSNCKAFEISDHPDEENLQLNDQPTGNAKLIDVLVIQVTNHKKIILLNQIDGSNGRYATKIINDICNDSTGIAIASHISGGTLCKSDLPSSKEHPKNYHYGEFHNEIESDKLWQAIKTCFNTIPENDKSSNKNVEAFDLLWQCLAPKPSEEAHVLRSKILSPFIPFHFYYQLKKDALSEEQEKGWKSDVLDTSIKEIQKVMNGNQIEELLKLKGTDANIEDAEKIGNFSSLKEYFSKDISECIKNDCGDDIINLAEYLETVVTDIESKEKVNG